MRENIELIPLIELPTFKDEESKITPVGSSLINSKEWDKYQLKEIKKNYDTEIEPIKSGIYQYEILKLDSSVLKKVIKLHISDLNIKESCSFFGGYGLKINNEIKLYPQCCGLFEEINDWKIILKTNFKPFYLKECHPSPKFSLVDRKLIITCEGEESFIPKTEAQIQLNHEQVKIAITNLIEQLNSLSKTIDELGLLFGEDKASKYLIWGES